jgi:hypothetical protein
MDDVKAVKAVKAEAEKQSLSDVLFEDGTKRVSDVTAAMRHLEAAKALLASHGIAVNLDAIQSEVQAYAKT